jgi:hypothetical protein
VCRRLPRRVPSLRTRPVRVVHRTERVDVHDEPMLREPNASARGRHLA